MTDSRILRSLITDKLMEKIEFPELPELKYVYEVVRTTETTIILSNGDTYQYEKHSVNLQNRQYTIQSPTEDDKKEVYKSFESPVAETKTVFEVNDILALQGMKTLF